MRRTLEAIFLVSTDGSGKSGRPFFKVEEGVVFGIENEPQAICDDGVNVVRPVLHEGGLIDLVCSTSAGQEAKCLFNLLLLISGD